MTTGASISDPSSAATPLDPPGTGSASALPVSPGLLRAIVLVRGLTYVGLGVAILVWPGITLLALAVLTGIQLMVVGVLRIVGALVGTAEASTRAVATVLGVLTLVTGVVCVRHPVTSLVFLVVVVAVGWLVEGIAAVFGALTGKASGLRGAYGVLSVVSAVSILVWPGLGLSTLVWLAGWFFLVAGLVEAGGAVFGVARRAPTVGAPAPEGAR